MDTLLHKLNTRRRAALLIILNFVKVQSRVFHLQQISCKNSQEYPSISSLNWEIR